MDWVEEFVRTEVTLGRRTCAEIMIELTDEGDRERAWPVVAEAFAEHLAAQADWPAVTDNDRVTAAFRRLDADGILAREGFTSTISDGRYEIHGLLRHRPEARGYAFYHRQDEGTCAAGGGLLVAYGARTGDGDTAAVGREVAAALAAEGLDVDWDGDPASRIRVRMAWRVRRTGPLAAAPPAPLPADGDERVGVDRWDWSGPTEPPLGSQSAAVLAGAYLPLLPPGARVKVFGDRAAVEFTRDGDELVAATSIMELPDGPDGEPVFRDEPAVRVPAGEAWPLLRAQIAKSKRTQIAEK
ncbi:DUF6891 domain-containing protein [Dactylosporangium sp. CA-092794]|uniref:DUF6891 domain-containing protein n=1 Tax=Dactylosporangium sp. CA-092794 TaxID=3239929 RepID=UPI003D8B09ED